MRTVHVIAPAAQPATGIVCSFFCQGYAVAQPRKVSVKMGGFTRTIEAPSKHGIHKWKSALRDDARSAMGGRGYVEQSALRVELLFLMPRPGKLLTKKWAERFLLHSIKPDCDNLAKAVKDACKAIVWKDDCQVSTLLVRKQYTMPGECPGVRIGVFLDAPEPIPFWP